MDLTLIVFIVFFALGLALFIYGMYVLLRSKETREERLIKAAGFSFVANWLLFLPVETLRSVGEKFNFLDLLEGIFSSLIKNFGVYFGNGLDRASIDAYPVFSDVYAVLQLVISSVLLIIAAGFLIGIMDGPVQYLKMMLGKKRDIYIFSECNEKTLSVAESLYEKSGILKKKTDNKQRKQLLIFSAGLDDISVYEKKKIKEMGGVFVKDSLRDILIRMKSSTPKIEVFLFAKEEEKNLEKLGDVLQTVKDDCSASVRVFVELTETPWCVFNDVLDRYGYDNNQMERVIINFVRDEESFVYNDLYRNSIFEHAIPSANIMNINYDPAFERMINETRTKKKRKEIEKKLAVDKKIAKENEEDIKKEIENSISREMERFEPLVRKTNITALPIKDIHCLIVGVNSLNIEMLKALLHLGQMPGYRLHIDMFDESDRLSEIQYAVRELEEDVDRYGDAVYHFRYEKNVNPFSVEFERMIQERYRDFTFVFVNVGNDLNNVNIAMKINSIGYRLHRSGQYRIQAFIENKSVCDRWKPELLYGIDLVGDLKARYNYDYIVLSDIEKASKEIHDVRYKGAKSWASYCNDEYNRHSVFARTLSFKYKVQVVDDDFEGDYSVVSLCPTWLCYEHMRWNMYTRTVGYDYDAYGLLTKENKYDKKIRNLARVHQDLILYQDLELDVQLQDGLELTDEIVKILKTKEDDTSQDKAITE